MIKHFTLLIKKRFLWIAGKKGGYWCLGPLGLIYFFLSPIFLARAVFPILLITRFYHFLVGSFGGYFCEFKLSGPGFRVWVLASTIFFKLGYCVLLLQKLPLGIFAAARKQLLVIFSLRKSFLFSFARRILALKRMNPYTGKGIIFAKVPVKLKLGKQRR